MTRPSRIALHEKVIFITGAGSGIGATVAELAYAHGSKVVLVDVNPSIDSLADRLGDRAFAVHGDVTSRSEMELAAKRAVDTFGRIDIVFANAGIAADPPTTIAAMLPEVLEQVIAVDLHGVYRTVHATLPQIRANNGHILLTASIYAYVNGVVNAPYAMSKAAVEMFGRSLRSELAGTGATAGVLYPGWTRTPIVNSAFGGNQAVTELIETVFPRSLRTLVSTTEVAEAALAGMTRRSARIHVPKRWAAVSAGRGLVNPLTDLLLDRYAKVHKLVRKLE
ncbi:hypothetical protein CH272_11985 [Rhodococcus sp. 05-340-1]|uniref:SDR family NAD(P)-dependent oxidoreductase n=1 Tax=unclassified Rhodococcus (in: high G+C Gram-positive bacteria) TaxID=192944 RepID=UPI000B9AD047|nr:MULTISPECIES: SDR family NAD(P)-dependent oxidoreductase [unclassified Rhodococcus (in: high G+C Gram-positive bacteria)]OZD62126.1 hypothetical protein CH271_24650 [Rhodococcus sp. 05-340-2]OZD78415.1 hypothetical protein CH272_11985 [Rhodococcus sp. 05-340-1]